MAVHCLCHTPTPRDQNMQGWFHCVMFQLPEWELSRPHHHLIHFVKYHNNHPKYCITDNRNVMRRNNATYRMNTTFCTLHFFYAGTSRKPGIVQSAPLRGEASGDVQWSFVCVCVALHLQHAATAYLIVWKDRDVHTRSSPMKHQPMKRSEERNLI